MDRGNRTLEAVHCTGVGCVDFVENHDICHTQHRLTGMVGGELIGT
jgi:hypothetical protein